MDDTDLSHEIHRNTILMVLGSLTRDQAMMNLATEGNDPALLGALLVCMTGYAQHLAEELHGSREAAIEALRAEVAAIP